MRRDVEDKDVLVNGLSIAVNNGCDPKTLAFKNCSRTAPTIATIAVATGASSVRRILPCVLLFLFHLSQQYTATMIVDAYPLSFEKVANKDKMTPTE